MGEGRVSVASSGRDIFHTFLVVELHRNSNFYEASLGNGNG